MSHLVIFFDVCSRMWRSNSEAVPAVIAFFACRAILLLREDLSRWASRSQLIASLTVSALPADIRRLISEIL